VSPKGKCVFREPRPLKGVKKEKRGTLALGLKEKGTNLWKTPGILQRLKLWEKNVPEIPRWGKIRVEHQSKV